MTPEENLAFEAKIRSYVGREVGAPKKGKDEVNKAMIRHWAEVTGDENPVYTDEVYAAASSKGGIIAPPAMLQIWAMEGYSMCQTPEMDVQREMHEVFDAHGYTGVLATNARAEYQRELCPGDQIVAHTVIESVSERKNTARGVGYFIETVTRFTDQTGAEVGRQVFRVLKFEPLPTAKAAEKAPTDAGAPVVATRIQAPRSYDNDWWWQALENGKLLIQRCKQCGTLRHPTRPMCGECNSVEWDSIEASMEGEVFSYTEVSYPKFPGYPTPLICGLIQLKEGTRIVANIIGCDLDKIFIGMKVKGKVERVDAKTVLPNFYPA